MSPHDGNVFYIYQTFDESMESDIVVPLIKEIQRQRERADGYIDLYINSFGGYIVVFRQIHELVEIAKRSGVTVRTIVSGVAGSAASMLAIAGSPGERYIGRHAEHAIHYGSSGAFAESPVQAERGYASMDQHFKEVVAHYKAFANVPDLEDHIRDGDKWVGAREAIKWGLADKYIDRFDIGTES